jgi:predicted transposase YdaD
MLRLPEDLEQEFKRELIAFEEQAKMPYVTSIERLSRQEGRETGREEGRQEGRQQGEARVLLRLITLKFGPPSEAVREQIATADSEALLRWSERILTAQTLDEVLQ